VVAGSLAEVRAELGDLLLAVASLARRLEVSAELALRDATARLVSRASAAEALARARGATFATLNQPVRDALWEAAKRSPC